MNVLFVHGYSETSLGAYFDFPDRLKAAMPAIDQVALAAFNSLDDTVTIDDLAEAMEERVAGLAKKWSTGPWAVICHSTGALIARRWLLNRLGNAPIPTHLITMAGANHGSSLAQMGKSVLGYFQKLFIKHSPTVGANVLTDLDYGSDFLLRLNSEWMERWNDGSLDALSAFSMGGDSVGDDPTLQIFRQTHEPGSDNTVRISGANLNYTIIEVAHSSGGPIAKAVRPKRPVPHLVIQGYSHFGSVSGILGSVRPEGDASVDAVVRALNVSTPAEYAQLATTWTTATDAWTAQARAAHRTADDVHSSVNSSVVFTLEDESGRSIDDCVITILDQDVLGTASNTVNPAMVERLVRSANNVSSAILPHSPIHNNVERGSYSFYFDYYKYIDSSPHWFSVEASLPTELISYVPLIFTQPPELAHTIFPNEFTYLKMTMKRDTISTYAVYEYGPTLNFPGDSWMPFPPGNIP